MEGEDGHAAAWCQHVGQLVEEGVKYLKFTVHINAQGLKGSCACFFHGFFPLFFRNKAKGLLNQLPHFRGGVYLFATANGSGDAAGNLLRIWLIGIFHQHTGQFFPVDRRSAAEMPACGFKRRSSGPSNL